MIHFDIDGTEYTAEISATAPEGWASVPFIAPDGSTLYLRQPVAS